MSRYAEQHAADLVCECCGNAAPGEVAAQPDDGESGTYAAVCLDFNACMARLRTDMEAYLDTLERQEPVYGHDDRTPAGATDDEMPF